MTYDHNNTSISNNIPGLIIVLGYYSYLDKTMIIY